MIDYGHATIIRVLLRYCSHSSQVLIIYEHLYLRLHFSTLQYIRLGFSFISWWVHFPAEFWPSYTLSHMVD